MGTALWRYLIPVLTSAAALWLGLALEPHVAFAAPLLALAAVMASARFGGRGPGLAAAALGAAGCAYLWLTPATLAAWLPVAVLAAVLGAAPRRAADEHLRASERLNHAILSALPASIAVLDREGRITAVNEPWERFRRENGGPDGGGGPGANYLEVCRAAGSEAREAMSGIREVIAGARAQFALEYPCHSPTERRWYLLLATPLPTGAGGAVVSHLEITERKRAEEAVRESEERFRQLAENIEDVFWIVDARDLSVLYVSPAYERLWGCDARRLYADRRVWREVIHPDDRERSERAYFEGIAAGAVDQQYRIVLPDGTVRWLRDRGFPVRDGSGAVYRVAGIAEDITERMRAEEERARLLACEQDARLEAEAANRIKDEFLATVSHELRTPLNAVLGWAQLLRRGQLDEESTGRAIETIERSARLQAQIIADILDVSRIITGKLRLSTRAVDLLPVIKAAIDAVRPAAAAKGVRLQAVLDPGAGPVSGDPDRLQQVIWNLLSNAVKFTPQGGRAEVRLERVDSHVEVIVSDTGQGISAEFLPFVFDRFSQADSSRTRLHGGLGLGLAIVRHLVELHGGTARADSPGSGRGATFTISLPLCSPGSGSTSPDPSPDCEPTS